MKSRLLRWLREGIILVALLVVVMLAMDWWRAPVAPPYFESMSLQTLGGSAVTLETLSADKPLLVYFWASWCGVCRFTTPDIAKLYDEGNNVMTIALRSGTDDEVMKGLQRKGYHFPVINDPSGTISQHFQISVTPTMLVIYQGRVLSTTTGWTSYWGIKLRLWWATVA
ncbi:protein disulfide oxidoreductase [Klebsiella sp. BIGb0407]|uniref:protein disulfide oxidoreductase n=1 Tax=Klebsiella sp. BIGb0407 TaxID=2940603 RepID=UPI002167CCEE|nr:protein disulfide oxidoreductase [Klebsiella sp. BIGb0407]MCS3433543.1 thiol-disulfide isomerase/thioredoxin [Klebsiella sp. BIGb0407]